VIRVLVSDSLAAQGVEVLEQARGIEVLNRPGLKPDQLLSVIGDVEGLVIRSATKVTADVIARADKLKVIGRAGIGVDNVDVPAATARGIVVVNTPEGNNVTTAEHAIALMVSLARHIPQATASMKAGQWEKKKFEGMELFNRNLGVIGVGNIGRIVAERGRALGMRVLAHDPYLTPEKAAKLEIERVSFDELLARADVITVHVPKMKETVGLLGRAAFAQTKRGVLVINAARGGIVDEEAVVSALRAGRLAGAALDVFAEEPLTAPAAARFAQAPNLILTPHIAGRTLECDVRVSAVTAANVRRVLAGA
jgi:D-3-phosphoglycerate dehydrogenase